jgi:hypothetical protein
VQALVHYLAPGSAAMRLVCTACGYAGSVNITPNWHDRINNRTPFSAGWRPWKEAAN